MQITLTFKQTKGGYHQFENAALRGVVYFSEKAFAAPADVTVTLDGTFAAPAAGKAVDPAQVAAELDKANKALARTQARTQALTAQLANLVPAPAAAPVEEPVAPAPVDAPAPVAPAAKGKGKR